LCIRIKANKSQSQIRRLDLQIDKFQLTAARSRQPSLAGFIATEAAQDGHQRETSRALQLKSIIRALSTSSNSRPLLARWRLKELLSQTRRHHDVHISTTEADTNDADLEWLVVAKATVQAYGLILSTLLEQTIPLSDDIWYWDDVLGSYASTGLYTLQTWPLRFWQQTKEVLAEARRRYDSMLGIRESSQQASQIASQGWRKFWILVQDSIKDRSLAQARSRILSPFALSRTEARRKQNGLRKLREMNSCGIGLLVDEGMSFRAADEDNISAKGTESPGVGKEEWTSTIAKSISLMENILRNVSGLEVSVAEFEDGVFASVEDDPEIASTSSEGNGSPARPGQLVDRLIQILDDHLPEQEHASQALANDYGRPSKLVRYWIPGTVLILSGCTLLRLVTNRRAEIRQWIQEFGTTIIDFGSNWVIEPVKKLIGTIRHDESSEVAIMSKESLKADRASLERMVVDFAADHPSESGAKYTEAEMADIRAKVKEGDLTPVLRAYERDLQKPFIGTVRGDLVRALLIQIQKTKVDVEVAISGIDSLLKSQELLFGLIGLTPGILISFAAFRGISDLFGSRKGIRQNQKRGQMIRLLR
jgi:nuclear control of ATPase protein 2